MLSSFHFLIVVAVISRTIESDASASTFQIQVTRRFEGDEILFLRTGSRSCENQCNRFSGIEEVEPSLLLYSADVPSDVIKSCRCKCRGTNSTVFNRKCTSIIDKSCSFSLNSNLGKLSVTSLTGGTTGNYLPENLKIKFCKHSSFSTISCSLVSRCIVHNGFYENFGWKPLWSEESQKDFGIEEGGQLLWIGNACKAAKYKGLLVKLIVKCLVDEFAQYKTSCLLFKVNGSFTYNNHTSLELGSCDIKTTTASLSRKSPSKSVEKPDVPSVKSERPVTTVITPTTTESKVITTEAKDTTTRPTTKRRQTTTKSKYTTTKLKQATTKPQDTKAKPKETTTKPQDTTVKPQDTTARSTSLPTNSEPTRTMTQPISKEKEPMVLRRTPHDDGDNDIIVIGVAGVVGAIVFIMAIVLFCMMHRRRVRIERARKNVEMDIGDFERPPVTKRRQVDPSLVFTNAALETDAEDVSSGYASEEPTATAVSQFHSLHDDSDPYSSSPELNSGFLSDKQSKESKESMKETQNIGKGKSFFNELSIRAQVSGIRLAQLKEIDEENSTDSECDVTNETYVGSLTSNKSLENCGTYDVQISDI